MATRIQALAYAMGIGKQTNISTLAGSPSWAKYRKLNTDLYTPRYGIEDDAAEIGKGNEFATAVFPTAWDVTARIEKFASAEFVTHVVAYGLGGVSYASGTYTLTPIDPGVSLELPYFAMVEQLAEGGGQAIDHLFLGCAIEDWQLEFNSAPGRQSARMTANVLGSGLVTTPSGITLPGSPQTEHYMLSQSMSLVINGTDYVANKGIISGTIGWKNNLLGNAGYFPGSGLSSGAAVRGRIEAGLRSPSFQFTARLLHTSPEYAALIAQTTGTAVLTLTFDGTHTVTFTLEKVGYEVIDYGSADGIASVQVTTKPLYDATNGILSVSAQCGIVGIAQ